MSEIVVYFPILLILEITENVDKAQTALNENIIS